MNLSNIGSANPYTESAYSSQKTDYVAEANNREEEIRKFLYEYIEEKSTCNNEFYRPSSSDFATKRISLGGTKTNRTSINFDVNKYMASIKDEEW